jgi:hypothetical protein
VIGVQNVGKNEGKQQIKSVGFALATKHKQLGKMADMSDKIIKQGYLVKKGAKRKNWTNRWFVLRGNQLEYYKDPIVCTNHHQRHFTQVSPTYFSVVHQTLIPSYLCFLFHHRI